MPADTICAVATPPGRGGVGIVSRRDFQGEEKARLDEESGLWEKIG